MFFHVGIQDPKEHEVSRAEVGLVVGDRAHVGAVFENVVAWALGVETAKALIADLQREVDRIEAALGPEQEGGD